MKFWDRLTKLNVVIGIITGTIFIAPIIMNLSSVVGGNIPSHVPLWSLSLVMVFGIGLGFAWALLQSRLRSNTGSRNQGFPRRVGFDYSSAEPRVHGWTIYCPENGTEPIFKSTVDGQMGRVLSVIPQSDYSMDYAIDASTTKATTVEFLIHPRSEWFISFYVDVRSTDGAANKRVWLSITQGQTEPVYYMDSTVEWKIQLPAQDMGGGWIKVTANLVKCAAETFGKTGWRYTSLRKVRLRGELSVAYMEFQRAE